jgi:hypothetical protein
MKKKLLAGLALWLLMFGMAVGAEADTIAMSATGSEAWYWPGATIGWKFTSSDRLTINALGVWDEGGDGLVADHQVGIFNTSGVLLTSTTVTSGNTLTDGFRYAAISPFLLDAGSYIVGAYFPGTDDRGMAKASVTTSAEITYDQNLFLYNNGFTLPTDEWVGFDYGNIGPNFQYTTGAVPEPSTFLLLGAGLGGLALLRRKARK